MNFRIRQLLLLLVLIVTAGAPASEIPTVKKAKKSNNRKVTYVRAPKVEELRSLMGKNAQILSELFPLVISEADFSHKNNESVINKSVIELKGNFQKIEDHPALKLKGLSLEKEMLIDELNYAEKLFTHKKFAPARSKLLAVFETCSHCHSMTAEKKVFKVLDSKQLEQKKLSSIDMGDYYYIVRDYDRAMKYYNDYLEIQNAKNDDELILKALERKLNYFLRVVENRTGLKNELISLKAKGNLPSSIMKEVSDWITSLEAESVKEKFKFSSMKDDDMGKLLKTFIVDDEEAPVLSLTNSTEVQDLELSQMLLDYYQKNPKTPHASKILFWLANLEKRLNDDFSLAHADYYLLSCMMNFPKDKVAKDCFELFTEDFEFNFKNGDENRPGNSLPTEQVQKNDIIERLRKRIFDHAQTNL